LINLQLQNSIGNEVLVNQVGCYGINLGRIDFILIPIKESIGRNSNHCLNLSPFNCGFSVNHPPIKE
jgi:hypothetical protein